MCIQVERICQLWMGSRGKIVFAGIQHILCQCFNPLLDAYLIDFNAKFPTWNLGPVFYGETLLSKLFEFCVELLVLWLFTFPATTIAPSSRIGKANIGNLDTQAPQLSHWPVSVQLWPRISAPEPRTNPKVSECNLNLIQDENSFNFFFIPRFLLFG